MAMLIKRVALICGFLLFNAFILAVLLELFVRSFFWFPSLVRHSPEKWKNIMQEQIYGYSARDIVQLNPKSAIYDEGLTYTLKPGDFVFSNPEFSTKYHVNSLGVRDSEEALHAPDIVVTGDSFAMGWGVQQEETYAKLLEKKTGLKVLNASVSSYGTAREMGLVDRVDKSKMKFLIIEYCDNDLPENKAFVEHGFRLPIRKKQDYEMSQADLLARIKDYPFKYSFVLLGILRDDFKDLWCSKVHCEKPDRPHFEDFQNISPDKIAEYFIKTLQANQKFLNGVKIIVFEIKSDYQDNDDVFTTALERRIEKNAYPEFIKRMKVIDVSKILPREVFYDLDDHMRATGHVAIADKLFKVISEWNGGGDRD